MSADPNSRIFHLDLTDLASPKMRVTGEDALTAEQKQLREKHRQDPKWQARMQRFEEVIARGPAPVALTDASIGSSVLAKVLVDPNAEQPRLIVAAATTFNDDVLSTAQRLLKEYELAAPASPEVASLTLLSDGVVEIAREGGVKRTKFAIAGSGRDSQGVAAKIAKRAEKLAAKQVRGVGSARVVDLRGEKGQEP